MHQYYPTFSDFDPLQDIGVYIIDSCPEDEKYSEEKSMCIFRKVILTDIHHILLMPKNHFCTLYVSSFQITIQIAIGNCLSYTGHISPV